MNKEFLAIIPARGGSKGIKLKNIVDLNGLPLIAYTIEAAKKSKNRLRVIVSTENNDISVVAQELKAEVQKRPINIAQDNSSSEEVIHHCLNLLKSNECYVPDYIVLLQPTSPLRTYAHIDQAIDLITNTNCSAVISVVDPPFHPLKAFKQAKDGYLTGIVNNGFCFSPRQELPPALIPNGAIYIIKTDIFLQYNTLLPHGTLPLIMSKIESLDIDDIDDLKIVTYFMTRTQPG